jgi:hypothetical protein
MTYVGLVYIRQKGGTIPLFAVFHHHEVLETSQTRNGSSFYYGARESAFDTYLYSQAELRNPDRITDPNLAHYLRRASRGDYTKASVAMALEDFKYARPLKRGVPKDMLSSWDNVMKPFRPLYSGAKPNNLEHVAKDWSRSYCVPKNVREPNIKFRCGD